jgi:hypothetical protein
MDRTPARACLRHRLDLAGGTLDGARLPGCGRDPAAWEIRLVLASLARLERVVARVRGK